jgi:hypothetical protein
MANEIKIIALSHIEQAKSHVKCLQLLSAYSGNVLESYVFNEIHLQCNQMREMLDGLKSTVELSSKQE